MSRLRLLARWVFWGVLLLLLLQGHTPSWAESAPLVGVNVVNPMTASVAEQDAIIAQLKAAGVHLARTWTTADDKGIDLAKRFNAAGIRIVFGLGAQYPPNAPRRAYRPDEFPSMWGGAPLSAADVELSRAYFKTLIDRLEDNGIVLAALELGNEINWAAFNGEFPLPGEGKTFTLDDLSHDPEGQQIAKGYLQYLKVLAALKDVRDHSRLNRTTPILTAGLVDAVDGAKLYNTKKEDMVGLAATLNFMRAHGLDTLVDGYAVHTYPSAGQPGDPAAGARRAQKLTEVTFAQCRPPGSRDGKPCWITEWGFENRDMNCPIDERARTLLVRETHAQFAKFAADRRLAGIFYFTWSGNDPAKQPPAYAVYRCGALTEAGWAALAPF